MILHDLSRYHIYNGVREQDLLFDYNLASIRTGTRRRMKTESEGNSDVMYVDANIRIIIGFLQQNRCDISFIIE